MRKKKRLSLTIKVMIGFSLITTIVLLSNIFNFIVANGIERAAIDNNKRVIDLEYAYDLRTYIEILYGFQSDMTINFDLDHHKAYKENVQEMEKVLVEIEVAADTDEENMIVSELKVVMDKYITAVDDIVAIHDDNSLTDVERKYKYMTVNKRTQQEKNKMLNMLEQVLISFEAERNSANDTMMDALRFTAGVQVITMILIAICSIIIGLLFSRMLVGNIKKLVQGANIYASGDLTYSLSIESNDEVGDLANAFDKMGENLRKLITEVVDISQHLLSSSEELSATSQETSAGSREVTETVTQIAEGTGQQADAIEKTASLINDVNLKVMKVSENTDQVNQSTKKTTEVAENGVQLSKTAGDKINQVMEVFEKITCAITSLEGLSNRIGSIADVINSISDQTNLLALNAAIEAARAGEQGRGFAVVAEEIRKLAEQSTESVKQVSQLTNEIAEETSKAVIIIEHGNKDVKDGVVAVSNSGEAFVAIMNEFENVTDQVQEVVAAIKDINVSSNKATDEIDSIAAIIEESAASSQEVAAISEQQSLAIDDVAKLAQNLATIGEQLSKEVNRFKI
ncbi:MAG: hypothetical protein CVV02_11925 [Firmicutes bacterium HGW-Firmicutes-7]|nr:MAG: hypothetical protein CVV02_11925 [Firmicutes bacterium HGW-Firmicutes-7]